MENDPKPKGKEAKGFKGIFQSNPGPEQIPPAQEGKTRRKQKPNEEGYLRYTFMIKAELLPEIKEAAQLAKVDIKDVLNSAIQKYLSEHWTPEQKEAARKLRDMV